MIPGMVLIRPADANETVAAWRIAIERRERPVALVFYATGTPVLDLARYPGYPQVCRLVATFSRTLRR